MFTYELIKTFLNIESTNKYIINVILLGYVVNKELLKVVLVKRVGILI